MSKREQDQPTNPASVPSAQELRMIMLEKQMAELERQEKIRKSKEKQHTDFLHDFLEGQVTEKERAMIRRLVMTAVAQGKEEVLVYSFPSELCSDGGRAINNAEPNWPATLQGKAKELYDRFKENVQPQGYKLKASILNFPKGMPGDVGFHLSWGDDGI